MRFRSHSFPLSMMHMVFAILPVQATLAQHSPPANHDPSVARPDLASVLQSTPSGQQELLSNALRIIHSMESSPTCNRLAALTLINSCKSLEPSSEDSKKKPDEVLDYVKSEYAARLAVCELIGATVTPPRECAILIPSSNACVKNRFKSLFQWHDEKPGDELCYPEASRSQFERCLRTLDSRAQWWISYSNARQNAVVMCQASRDAIEKEEKLYLYKSLADATVDITSALSNSIKEAQMRLNEQLEFIESIRKSQAEVLQNAQQSTETSSRLGQMVTDVHGTFMSFMALVSQAWVSADTQAQDLHESLAKSKVTLNETHNELKILLNGMVMASSQHTELATAQNGQLQVNHEAALAIQNALDFVRRGQLHTLTEAIGTLQEHVHESTRLVEDMYDRQTEVDERVQNLNGALDTLEGKTITLQTTIEETAGTVQILATFLKPGAWSAAGAVVLLIVGAWFANRRAAGIIMAVSGLSYLLYLLPTSKFITEAAAPAFDISVSASVLALSILGAASVVLLATLFGRWIKRTYFFEYEDEYGEKVILPMSESPSPLL